MIIEINPENMYCFSVNPKCSNIMHQWSQMIPISNVTRWTKRYWNPTLKLTTATLKPTIITTKQSFKKKETTEFYYDYSELDESKKNIF